MESKLYLKKNPTLKDYQKYVKILIVERGFENENAEQRFVMLMEEVGELARACRKSVGMSFAKDTHLANLEEESADVFILLLKICDYFNIDLETAFRQKEEKNKERVWK